MTKFSVTKDGKVLDPSLYTWDENTKTFSTKENGLVLDFTGVNRVTFNTRSYCTFNTGDSCTFNTGYSCTFNAGFDCTFKTGSECIFNTGSCCVFNTYSDCTFNTDSYCIFDTGYSCTFNTGSSCAFKTSSDCTFEVGDNCCLIRLDVKGVTKIPTGKKIKLNESGIAGYTIIEEKKEISSCDGKIVEIDGKKYKLIEQ
jgi:hypothetical protein